MRSVVSIMAAFHLVSGSACAKTDNHIVGLVILLSQAKLLHGPGKRSEDHTSLLAICILLSAFVFVGDHNTAHAQRFDPTIQREQERRQQRNEERIEDLRRTTPGGGRIDPERFQQGGPDAVCFAIKDIQIEGVTLFPLARFDGIKRDYVGKCVGLGAIGEIQRKITLVYIDGGYIASRAYVPEQDLSGGTLRFVVVEGFLDRFSYNGEPVTRNKGKGIIGTAFPGMIGKPLNLRDMEQGLDQINRLKSQERANTEVLPGEKPGASIIAVTIPDAKRWYASLGTSSQGQRNTGLYKADASIDLENVLGINDLWTFSYEQSMPHGLWNLEGRNDDFDRKQTSASYSGSISIPYGYWTFSGGGSYLCL